MRSICPVVCLVAAAFVLGCGSEEGSNGDDAQSQSSDQAESPDVDAIKVEAKKLVYLADQEGGNYHTASVLLRNTSDQVAVDVGGQISVKDSSGDLVETTTPTSVTILPGELGLLLGDALDLPVAVKNGTLKVNLAVESFIEPPKRSPVTFSKVKYQRGDESSIEPCKVRGTVRNTFSKPKDDLQLRVVTFEDGKLAGGAFTYVDKVFPKTDATFKVDFTSPSECPDAVDRIEVMPNLGLDKITDP